MNLCIFMGHLGKDPETISGRNGSTITSFSIAVNSGYGDKKETMWVRCCCFNKVAESVSKFCRKGHPVLVEGRLRESNWTDRDGNERKSTEIVCNAVKFLKERDHNQEDETEAPAF